MIPAGNQDGHGAIPGRIPGQVSGGRMFTARAMTRAPSESDTPDWTSMVSLAQRASGMTSVGLNAVALVNDRYR